MGLPGASVILSPHSASVAVIVHAMTTHTGLYSLDVCL